MQFLNVTENTTLSDLKDIVGPRNLAEVLAVNGLKRSPDIGKQLLSLNNSVESQAAEVDWQRKSTFLNSFSQDSDIFESAALCGESSWKVLSATGTFPGMIKMPDGMTVPESSDTLGNGIAVASKIFNKVMSQVTNPPHDIDPSTFSEISSYSFRPNDSSKNNATDNTNHSDLFRMFQIPWGEVSIYSSFGDKQDIPVYPETVDDGVQSNYSEMPDLIYQYEPWLVYSSSGPRSCSYQFHMHRDMWTGDHRDGKCNELIRFLEAQCFPLYSGSIVATPTVSLYIKGNCLIHGIMNSVKPSWSGPILSDGWYAEVLLEISITEISKKVLNYDTVKSKSLIG